MKKQKIKLILVALMFIIGIILSTSVFGANEEIQILQKAENQYMIYIADNMYASFEFAYSNDKEINKEHLNYKTAAKDAETEEKNYVAYVDEKIYTEFFSKPTYLWARTIEGEYFVEGIEIDLEKATKQSEVDLVNNITKIIKVNTQNTVTTGEMQGEVKVTKVAGKVDILEEGNTYYQLIELPNNEQYNELMKTAEQISNNKVENNMYAKLEVTRKFVDLYKELVPEITDKNWIKVENNEILQSEDSKQGEQYILWLKTENNKETKIDAQFLTCFEDYKPEVISEKIVTKLPVTNDNPVLFIILGILVIAFVIILFLRLKTNKKEDKN